MIHEESEKDNAEYLKWYNEFQMFLKEGLAMDTNNQE